MQAGLAVKKSRPFIVDLFKRLGHFRLVRSMGDGDGRLKEKPVLEKFDVIPQGIGIKDLKALVELFSFLVEKRLKGGHHIYLRKEPFP